MYVLVTIIINCVYSSNLYFINYSAYFIDFTPGETREYIFVDDGDRELQRPFSTTEDFVVERIEVFEVVLTVNDSRVRIRDNEATRIARIRDDDGKFVYFLLSLLIKQSCLSVYVCTYLNEIHHEDCSHFVGHEIGFNMATDIRANCIISHETVYSL